MKKLQSVTREINEITYQIEKEYPELYQFLNENPITLPVIEYPEMNLKIFNEYLDSLKELLRHHIELHKNGERV